MQLQNTLHLLLVAIYPKPVYKIKRNRFKNPPILWAYCSTHSCLLLTVSLHSALGLIHLSMTPTTTPSHQLLYNDSRTYIHLLYTLLSLTIPSVLLYTAHNSEIPFHILATPHSAFETSILACSRGLVTPRTYLSSPSACKKSKTTTPRIPMWSPTMVLTKRYSAWLRRSDGMRYFLSPMAVDTSMFKLHSYTGTATPP